MQLLILDNNDTQFPAFTVNLNPNKKLIHFLVRSGLQLPPAVIRQRQSETLDKWPVHSRETWKQINIHNHIHNN